MLGGALLDAMQHVRGEATDALPCASGAAQEATIVVDPVAALHRLQGCVVRKAWVRHNFKAGGSTRRLQLAPGSGGRPGALFLIR